MKKGDKPATYKSAGVDIEAGDRAVDLIKELARSTFSPNVISDIGGFSGMFSLKDLVGDDPVLVSGTDGVGTKLKLAFMSGRHDTVGIDAVAMCVNDVICTGAKPLFFLDYIATGKLEPGQVKDVVSGIAAGCRSAGCALVGGEMAEMPGFYSDGEYDIAGFCVGIIDRSKIIDGSKIKSGDVVIGLPSSGFHSNGFSLVRKVVFEDAGIEPGAPAPEPYSGTVAEMLLEPTIIYAKQLQSLQAAIDVRGIANITGGGIYGNITRIIPDGLDLAIEWSAWKRPAVFDYVQELGSIAEEEMRNVFNCGIGMAVIVDAADVDGAIAALKGLSLEGVVIGRIE